MKQGVTVDEQQALFDAFEDHWKDQTTFYTLDDEYNLNKELESLERDRVIQALENAKGNQTKAAEILKIGRTCLIAKMKKFNLS